MKCRIIALSLLASVVANASSLPPLPIEWRVANANVIVVGIASNLVAADLKGQPLIPEPKQTHIEQMLVATVRVQKTLKLSGTILTNDLQIEFGRGFILSVSDWKERFLGQELVFLLNRRGDRFESVWGLQMYEETNTISRIKEIIANHAEQSVPGYDAQGASSPEP